MTLIYNFVEISVKHTARVYSYFKLSNMLFNYVILLSSFKNVFSRSYRISMFYCLIVALRRNKDNWIIVDMRTIQRFWMTVNVTMRVWSPWFLEEL